MRLRGGHDRPEVPDAFEKPRAFVLVAWIKTREPSLIASENLAHRGLPGTVEIAGGHASYGVKKLRRLGSLRRTSQPNA